MVPCFLAWYIGYPCLKKPQVQFERVHPIPKELPYIKRKTPRRESRRHWKAFLIMLVASMLFIAFILLLGYIYGHPGISVEITGPAEMQVGDLITYNVTVTNTGDRDLFNLSVNDSYGFRWTGSLAVKQSRMFLIEFNGSIMEEVVNKVRVDGYTEKGWHVWNQDSWTVVIIYDLLYAVDEKLVVVKFSGTGYCSGDSIKLKITPKLDVSIEIEITPGLILINSGSGQNMIIAEASFITVKPEVELDFDIEAYCLDLHKSNPSSKETLSIQTYPGTYGENVLKLMKSLENVTDSQKLFCAIQIALWVITDDISIEDIRIDYSVSDIGDAEWLLENAGIDTIGKKLFQK